MKNSRARGLIGGGILALIVAGAAHELLRRYSFFPGYAAILSIGAATLAISAVRKAASVTALR